MAPAALMLLTAALAWGGYAWLAQRAELGADWALEAVGRAPAEADLKAVAVAAAGRALGAPITHVDFARVEGRLSLRLAFDLTRAPLYGKLWRMAPLAPPTVVVEAHAR